MPAILLSVYGAAVLWRSFFLATFFLRRQPGEVSAFPEGKGRVRVFCAGGRRPAAGRFFYAGG